MIKVYCEDCRYSLQCSSPWGGSFLSDNCGHNISKKIIDTPGEWKIKYVKKIKDLNKNNDCKYYKRSWWKFWIKEK